MMDNSSVPFSLHDNGLMIGREREHKKLIDAYNRCLCAHDETAKRELVLVTGPSGCGKTTLAKRLRETVNGKGLLITGKFDYLQRPEPYSAVVSAFTDFSNQILASGDTSARLSQLRHNYDQSPESDRKILLRMIPSLYAVLGCDNSTTMSSSSDSDSNTPGMSVLHETMRRRFPVVLVRFLRLACSAENPLVLLLDDLQWADRGSLELIRYLLLSAELKGLMIVGTVRDNEVDRDDLLARMLRLLEAADIVITNIRLKELGRDDHLQLVSAWLGMSSSSCDRLARVVYRQTGGNIFYTYEYLRLLHADGVLSRKDDMWEWDIQQLDRESAPTAVNFVGIKLASLASHQQEVLKTASILGSTFNLVILAVLLPSQIDVDKTLHQLCRIGLFVAKEEEVEELSFGHDQFQQASYGLIPVEERPMFHFSVANKLRSSLSPADLERHIFLVASQVERCAHCLTDHVDRREMAALAFQACARATKLAAFTTALTYVSLAIDLLPENHWKDHYGASLIFHNAAAEVAYCTADIEMMDAMVDAVLSNARSLDDKLQVIATKVNALGSQQRISEACDMGIRVVRELGERIPSNPGVVTVVRELLKCRRMLRGKTMVDLLTLPPMRDKRKLAAVRLLDIMTIFLFMEKSLLMPVVVCRQMQLTLKYGQNAMTSCTFGLYALILMKLGQIEEGYKYQQIAMEFYEKHQKKEWQARVYFVVYGTCSWYMEPLRRSLEPLRAAYTTGLETGDITVS